MNFLRFADPASVKRYTHEESGEWIELHSTLSKGQMNQLIHDMPDSILRGEVSDDGSAVLVLRETPKLAKALFAAMVQGWSIEGVAPTVEAYLNLEGEAAGWIDGILFQHLNGMNATREEAKKPTTSPRASRKVTPEKAS